MKALILNSGLGKRIEKYTQSKPKCMIPIYQDETILSRQLRLLVDVGITEVVITTGAFADELVEYCDSLNLPLHYCFVYNERYANTNYIYSIYCARKWLEDDIILMHGDLVFDIQVLDSLLAYPASCMAVNLNAALPQKDFKAVILQGNIAKIGIEFFENAVSAQPLYKLNQRDWKIWLKKICEFCEQGNMNCYAENAFNEISDNIVLMPYDVGKCLCNEIDTEEDLQEIIRKFQK